MAKTAIAIVEDEYAIARLLQMNLQAEGYEVQVYGKAEDFLPHISADQPQLLILDLMLPGMDGLAACRHIRGQSANKFLPIIMLTAKGEEIDRVLGLEMGADDYMTKPFSVREVLARVKAQLRRAGFAQQEEPELAFSGLRIDARRYVALYQGKALALSTKEYELLCTLMRHPGWVYTREQLLEQVWGYSYAGESRAVDMHIANLRKKLEEAGAGGLIETVRGVGYRMADGGAQ